VIKVWLPSHLQRLALAKKEILVDVSAPVTLRRVMLAVEAKFPELQGTIVDRATGRRRDYLRVFALEEDLSNEDPDAVLPERVIHGNEPLLLVAAIAGGSLIW
jgi:hypothetical protein